MEKKITVVWSVYEIVWNISCITWILSEFNSSIFVFTFLYEVISVSAPSVFPLWWRLYSENKFILERWDNLKPSFLFLAEHVYKCLWRYFLLIDFIWLLTEKNLAAPLRYVQWLVDYHMLLFVNNEICKILSLTFSKTKNVNENLVICHLAPIIHKGKI